MMGYQALLLDRADGIATITMNRPEARNALNLTMREEMLGALDELERDPAVRVVLLTGAGGHFSAGGDVKSMQKKHTAAEGRARVELLNRFVLRLFSFSKPTIAMVDGFAVGAGCNIALGCDMIVASDRAKFGEVFLKVGLVPDGGGTWLLQRLVGLAKAKEMVLTAEIIDAAEALRIGLVNAVVPAGDLWATTTELADEIAANAPLAVQAAKRAINGTYWREMGAWLEWEGAEAAPVLLSEDRIAGFQAGAQRKRAEFRGR